MIVDFGYISDWSKEGDRYEIIRRFYERTSRMFK